jgi:lysozyme family protein
MAKSNFAAVMTEEFRHEGGYVDHPKDPGGATNMGITLATLSDHRKRKVTKAEVRALTKEEASEIYRLRYWSPIRGDDLPAGIDLATMDATVNSGLGRGPKWTQKALGVAQDGHIGPATLKAARASDPVAVIKAACAARMGFLRGLRTWGTFGRGWSRRVASVEAVGVAMAIGPQPGALRDLAKGAADARAADQRTATTAGAAGVTTGGTSWSMPENLPIWVAAIIAAILLVLLINALGRARHNKTRAEAFESVAKEISHG